MQSNEIEAIPPSRPLQHKARGWLFLNGNVAREEDLVRMFRRSICTPEHFVPEVDRSKKVLLITAAFERGQEHHDRHLIHMFERLHIDANWRGNFPQNIQNLSIYNMFMQFQKQEPWLYRRYNEKQEQIKVVKKDYYIKISHHVERLEELRNYLHIYNPDLNIFDFYHSDKIRDNPYFFVLNMSSGKARRRQKALDHLVSSPQLMAMCHEFRNIIDHLVYLDDEIFCLCQEIECFFLEKSGIRTNALYQEQRAELIKRITSSATIFIFGGRVFVLVNRLRFYELGPIFEEAIQMGTNIFGISAGSICQTRRFSLSFNRSGSAGDVFAADNGLGLVNGIRIFPHADDIRYIMDADVNELTLFTLRHRENAVIGLREKSVLLCETYRDPVDNNEYKRFSSIGEHPVMVFGERGEIVQLGHLDEMFMEGCKFYSGIVQVATRRDVLQLEKKWREQYQRTRHAMSAAVSRQDC
ncbi:Type 1 glutamine amidotransferase-like domain-containing protein [bacterium]|nr:Type 1 glutamine amidotransferase-like domain-containing protein [bacterium]